MSEDLSSKENVLAVKYRLQISPMERLEWCVFGKVHRLKYKTFPFQKANIFQFQHPKKDRAWKKSGKKLILTTHWHDAIETQKYQNSIAKAGCPPQLAAHL